MEIDNFKFTGTIYVRGETGSKCTIWLGGPLSSDSIAFRQGDSGIGSDNSCSDWLSIAEEGGQLKLKAAMAACTSAEDDIFTIEEAAEYLWRRFTEHVN